MANSLVSKTEMGQVILQGITYSWYKTVLKPSDYSMKDFVTEK